MMNLSRREFLRALGVHAAALAVAKAALAKPASEARPNIIVIMERYKDQAALAAHSGADYFKAFSAKVPEFLAGAPEITIMEEIHAA